MNRSEFDRYARDAEAEERRSVQVLAALVFVMFGIFAGAVFTEWLDRDNVMVCPR